MVDHEQVSNQKTYDRIIDVVKEIDPDSKEICLSLGVIDYDAPYLLHYNVSLHLPPYCDAKISVFDFLSRIDMLQNITILEQKKNSLSSLQAASNFNH